MSHRTKSSWVVRALTTLLVTTALAFVGVSSPASAATAWNPAPPVPRDICGTSQDAFLVPYTPDTAYTWNGNYISSETWIPTGGAATVTLVASYMVISDPQPADMTFTMTFDVRSDATCVDGVDTVITRIVACDPQTTGTLVEFTYVNTDDGADRARTRPVVEASRWDGGQYAYVIVADGSVADGQSASFIGGTGGGDGTGKEFFLSPGTYNLSLTTNETAKRKLPNTLFVPACAGRQPPKGDPMGGTVSGNGSKTPKGKLTQVSATKMKVKAINKGVRQSTKFKVIIDPKQGKTIVKAFTVKAGKSKVRTYKAMPRTRFVLKARVLVETGNGRLVAKWKVLTRSTLQRR